MSRHGTSHQRGISLVELLVTLTVTTFVVLLLSAFLLKNLQSSSLASIRQSVLQETQLSLDLAANDVRLSANADDDNRWPDSNNPLGAANPYGWTSTSQVLVLATAAEDSSGGVIFSDAKNYITEKNNIVYFVSGGTLYKRLIASTVANNSAKTSCPKSKATLACPADKELLHNVTLFNVTYIDGQNASVTPTDARSIELHVTVSKPLYRQNISADYTTRMVFRND